MNAWIKAMIYLICGFFLAKISNEIIYSIINVPSVSSLEKTSLTQAFLVALIPSLIYGYAIVKAINLIRNRNKASVSSNRKTENSNPFKPFEKIRTSFLIIKSFFYKSNFRFVLLLIVITVLTLLFFKNNLLMLWSNQISYDVYPSCKKIDEDCRKIKGNIKFDVNKEFSQVIIIKKELDASPSFIKLSNCVVVDKHNWECLQKPEDLNFGKKIWFKSQPYVYKMTDDNLTMSDSLITFSFNSNLEETKIDYGDTFVRR